MSNMLNKIVNDNLVWTALSSSLIGGRKGSNGSTMINCPMCVLRGETPDTRYRCGVGARPDGVIVHCYNCNFRAKYKIGESISPNIKNFMLRLGMSSRDVDLICYRAKQYSRMISTSPEAQSVVSFTNFHPTFQNKNMPEGALPFSEWAKQDDPPQDFLDVASYLFTRGQVVSNCMEYYWSPLPEHDINRRLLIPFYFDKRIVGWSGRLIDQHNADHPKYWSMVQPNFLFNNEILDSDHAFIPLVEGPLDAKAVDGIATLGAKLTNDQARWLNTCGKKIIAVADRDKSGQRWIDRALDNNWLVSFPRLKDGKGFQNWWDVDIKDCAAATERYGKLYTIRSILESATSNKIEINVKRKLLY